MVILAIIAIIVIPPDKLPEVARQVARFFNDIRRSTSGVWDDIKKDAMLKPEDLIRQQKPMPPQSPQAQPEQTQPAAQEQRPVTSDMGHGPESTITPDTTNTSETKKHE